MKKIRAKFAFALPDIYSRCMILHVITQFIVSRAREFAPLVCAGLIATCIDYGTLYLLLGVAGVAAVLAASAAFMLSTGTNFFLQKFWVYQDPRFRALPQQLAFFALGSLIGLLVNDTAFYAFNTLAGIGYILSEIPTMVLVSAVGLGASRWIFARRAAVVIDR